MKKTITLFLIFFLTFGSSYAEDYQVGKEILSFSEDTLSKINFGGKNFELIKNDIFINENEELKIKYFPEILKNFPKQKALDLIKNDKLQIYGQLDICGGIRGEWKKEDEICIYEDEFYFSPKRNFRETYKIISEKEEIIEFEYFPISPDYFPYYRNYTKNPPLLTIFTNNLDIFEPKIYIYQKFLGFNIFDNKFEKRYKLVKMSYGNYIYVPYYSLKLNLKKGENFFRFDYKKF